MNEFDKTRTQLADLRAVLALLQDGTVTRASQRLGMTQSALSYHLDRMRKRFADPLFVRVGNRMAPTPFVQRFAEPAARVLRIVETEIGGLVSFDPATSEREFRIGVNEIGAIALVPKLLRRLAEVAPNAKLAPSHVAPETMAAKLESGEFDLAAGHFSQSDGGLIQQLLYHRDYVCVARRDHPRIGSSMSLNEFSLAPQIRTRAVPATNGWVDGQLRKRKLTSNVRMTTEYVAAIPFMVAASDLIAVIPHEVYALFLPIAAIKTVRLPIAFPSLDIRQYWHPRVAGDPAVKFFRELVFSAAHER